MTTTALGRLKLNRAFGLGSIYLKQQRYSEALDQFKALLVEDPLLLNDALVFLYKSVAAEPLQPDIRHVLIELLIASRRFSEALDEIEELIELDDKNPHAYQLLGRLYKKNVHREAIKDIFEKAFYSDIYEPVILDVLPSLYLEEKNIYKSIILYEKLIEMRPEAFHYQKNLAGLYEKAGRYEEAAKLFEDIVLKSPASVGEAIDFCELLCKYSPTSLSIRKIVIHFYSKSCNPVMAVKHIKIFIATDPTVFSEAEQLYKALFELYPDTLEVNLGYAELLMKERRYTEASVFLKAVFEKDPNTPELHDFLAHILEHFPSQVLAQQLLVDVLIHKKESEAALAVLESMFQTESPSDYNIEPMIMDIQAQNPSLFYRSQYILARFLVASFQNEKAITEAKKLLGTAYDEAAGLVICNAYLGQEKYQNAWDMAKKMTDTYHSASAHAMLKLCFEKAIDESLKQTDSLSDDEKRFLQFKRGETNENLAMVVDEGDYSGKKLSVMVMGSEWVPLLVPVPGAASAQQVLQFSDTPMLEGVGAVFKKQYAEASDFFSVAQDLDPASGFPFSNKAITLLLQELSQSALDHIHKALECDPNQPVFYLNEGWIYAQQGRWDKALESASACLKLCPDFEPAHFLMGTAAIRQSMFKECLHHLKQAKTLPHFLEASQRLLIYMSPPYQTASEWAIISSYFPFDD
jgi:tetratricopeptide (TPR) repeat protein